ncbi:MAG: MmgE/PrpD family protein [Acidobacteriota bacterium]|nr:MmgE/PrpD family protein [Acidobacteriota bacterium]
MSLVRCADFAASAAWADLTPSTRRRMQLVVLDALGCAIAASRLGALEGFLRQVVDTASVEEATMWSSASRVPVADAALTNAAQAHYLDWDDGHAGGSVHGGATIVPVALACGEAVGAPGRDVMTALAVGYAVAVAVGRPLVGGIERHGLHPPAIAGAFGATAAAGRLLGLDAAGLHRALALTACLVPVAPFQAFTSGAEVKTLFAGWPASLGITAARLATAGLAGPDIVLSAPSDGLGRFLCHEPIEAEVPDVAELEAIAFKRFPACRALHPALTALANLLPLDPASVVSITVETFAFAVVLSREADATTPIGATTSIPYCLASLIVDGALGEASFARAALDDKGRRRLASRVLVRLATPDASAPRRTRVIVTLADGRMREASVDRGAWSAEAPATEDEVRAKGRQLAGPAWSTLEGAIEALDEAPDVLAVVGAVAGAMRAG